MKIKPLALISIFFITFYSFSGNYRAGRIVSKNDKAPSNLFKVYCIRANSQYEKGDYKLAIDTYLKASQIAEHNNNEWQKTIVSFNIGLVKNAIGDRNEAISIFRKCHINISKNKNEFPKAYVLSLYALADSYTYLKQSDSAQVYIDSGLTTTKLNKNNLHYSYFLYTAGVNYFYKCDYQNALNSLDKARKILETNSNQDFRLSECHYYTGRTLYNLNKKAEAILNFKKVDSLLSLSKDISPELLTTYNYLIEDARSNGNQESQIAYITALIRLDSIADTNYKYVKNKIVKKYDLPKLIKEKNQLILQLIKKESNLKVVILIGMIIIILIVLYFLKTKSDNRKKFNKLIGELNSKNDVLKKEEKPDEIGLSKAIIEELNTSIQEFEKSSKFISKTYTLNSLAKELKTNSAYLSKYINYKKGMNFSNYLNNLKVDYALKRLTSDKQFRMYTIKAIANESGFKNAQSFSKAFYKKTGIYPSYFVKSLANSNHEHPN